MTRDCIASARVSVGSSPQQRCQPLQQSLCLLFSMPLGMLTQCPAHGPGTVVCLLPSAFGRAATDASELSPLKCWLKSTMSPGQSYLLCRQE